MMEWYELNRTKNPHNIWDEIVGQRLKRIVILVVGHIHNSIKGMHIIYPFIHINFLPLWAWRAAQKLHMDRRLSILGLRKNFRFHQTKAM